MLTKCICTVEQWLIKAKTFCGKAFFKKRAFCCMFLLDRRDNISSRRTHGFAGHWWGWKPELSYLCKEQQIQQKRHAEKDTVSPH